MVIKVSIYNLHLTVRLLLTLQFSCKINIFVYFTYVDIHILHSIVGYKTVAGERSLSMSPYFLSLPSALDDPNHHVLEAVQIDEKWHL